MNINKKNKIHIIGIGGIGMSGIAEILHGMGYKVQGSDISKSKNVLRLNKKRIRVFIGHNKKNITNADIIIHSSAIDNKNPEMKEALKLKIPTLSRSSILSQLIKLKKTIAISGSHGKTTTTTLIASLISDYGLSPTVINGGIINEFGTNTRLGKGEWIIVEADESDGTFLKLDPYISVVTNIDKEHLEYYGNYNELKKSFKRFISNIPFYGFAVVCLDDPSIKLLVKSIKNTNIITYGTDKKSNIRAFNIRYKKEKTYFDIDINIKKKNYCIKNFYIPMLGKYNVLNALAAIAISTELDLSITKAKKSLRNFKGVNRRLTYVGKYNSIKLIDDYAHHPTEIENLLLGLKNAYPKSKITAVFQPHRYSRLIPLLKEFSRSFVSSDKVFISNVYSANERKPVNFNLNKIIKLIGKGSNTVSCYLNSLDDIKEEMKKSKKNEIYIFLGAGDITDWPYKILDDLNEN
tara:strand:- start:11019 stop:12410 length:1392 start_codon:yes stop_codon:yes gene_type:complete